MDRKNYQRYRVDGVLITTKPLRIGSGLDGPDRIGRDIRVMTVATDFGDRVFIPASALKGCLHQAANQSGRNPDVVRELFGTGDPNREVGGRLFFQDALIHSNGENPILPPLFRDLPEDGSIPLHWKSARGTYVMASTVLNRITRTAQANKLYHYEVVPEGTAFEVIIGGEALTNEELAFLLKILDQFNKLNGLTLGGLSAHGYGAMTWVLKKLTGLRTEDEVRQWLKGTSVGYDGFPEISGEVILSLPAIDDFSSDTQSITLDVEIQFEGPFMINDPSQCEKGDENGDIPDHMCLKDSQAQPLLTGKSLHGALRAQAERIVRTVCMPGQALEKKACYVDSRDKACRPIHEKSRVGTLCLTCQLFGGNGWRSPLTITDFHPTTNGKGVYITQDFVAIDRFTGGAADEKKFDARYSLAPTFSGQIRIDLSRINAKLAGLLVFTIRDLIDGDISLGSGRSKGFAACKARIVGATLPQIYPSWMDESLAYCEDRAGLSSASLNENQKLPLQSLIESFLREVNSDVIS